MKKLLIICILNSFILSDDTTSEKCPKNFWCVECEGDKCEECAFSFPNDDGLCVSPATEIDHCIAYKSATVCDLCQDGYYVSGSVCKEIAMEDCSILNFADTSKCYSCGDNK